MMRYSSSLTDDLGDARIKILSDSELDKLTTVRLLKYKNSLHQYVEDVKLTDEWKELYDRVKKCLAGREHVE